MTTELFAPPTPTTPAVIRAPFPGGRLVPEATPATQFEPVAGELAEGRVANGAEAEVPAYETFDDGTVQFELPELDTDDWFGGIGGEYYQEELASERIQRVMATARGVIRTVAAHPLARNGKEVTRVIITSASRGAQFVTTRLMAQGHRVARAANATYQQVKTDIATADWSALPGALKGTVAGVHDLIADKTASKAAAPQLEAVAPATTDVQSAGPVAEVAAGGQPSHRQRAIKLAGTVVNMARGTNATVKMHVGNILYHPEKGTRNRMIVFGAVAGVMMVASTVLGYHSHGHDAAQQLTLGQDTDGGGVAHVGGHPGTHSAGIGDVPTSSAPGHAESPTSTHIDDLPPRSDSHPVQTGPDHSQDRVQALGEYQKDGSGTVWGSVDKDVMQLTGHHLSNSQQHGLVGEILQYNGISTQDGQPDWDAASHLSASYQLHMPPESHMHNLIQHALDTLDED